GWASRSAASTSQPVRSSRSCCSRASASSALTSAGWFVRVKAYPWPQRLRLQGAALPGGFPRSRGLPVAEQRLDVGPPIEHVPEARDLQRPQRTGRNHSPNGLPGEPQEIGAFTL